MTIDDLTLRALGLPEADRAELAERLLESLDAVGSAADSGPAWEAELRRRCEAVHAGDVELVPSARVVSRLRRKLREAG